MSRLNPSKASFTDLLVNTENN